MQIQTILFPTDFSPASEAALDYAISLARDANAKLLLLHIAEPLPVYGDVPYYGVPEPDKAELERRLHAVSVDTRLRVERRLVAGYPAEQILAEAAKDAVDMIVMGTHGRTGLTRLLMGSVAERVVRGATCPVLAVKTAVPAAAQA
jgi:nucleotide-binding universal stress UspA family protein